MVPRIGIEPCPGEPSLLSGCKWLAPRTHLFIPKVFNRQMIACLHSKQEALKTPLPAPLLLAVVSLISGCVHGAFISGPVRDENIVVGQLD